MICEETKTMKLIMVSDQFAFQAHTSGVDFKGYVIF